MEIRYLTEDIDESCENCEMCQRIVDNEVYCDFHCSFSTFEEDGEFCTCSDFQEIIYL